MQGTWRVVSDSPVPLPFSPWNLFLLKCAVPNWQLARTVCSCGVRNKRSTSVLKTGGTSQVLLSTCRSGHFQGPSVLCSLIKMKTRSVWLWALCYFMYGRIKWAPGEQEAECCSQAALLPFLEIPRCVFVTSPTMEVSLAASLCTCELSRGMSHCLALSPSSTSFPLPSWSPVWKSLAQLTPLQTNQFGFPSQIAMKSWCNTVQMVIQLFSFKTKPGQNFAS